MRPAVLPDDPLACFRGGACVVTGAAGGLGASFARLLAAAGAKVVLIDVDGPRVMALADEIAGAGLEVVVEVLDLRDGATLAGLPARVADRFGPTRLLVNNAAVETLGTGWSLSRAAWERTLDINLLAPIAMASAFLPGMIAHGEPSYLANVCSIGSLCTVPYQTAYITTKHGLLAYTECLKAELAGSAPQVSVSAVLPGTVRTGIFAAAATGQGLPESYLEEMNAMLAHGMDPCDAAAAILSGIAQGQFWVSSHPDMLAWASRTRAETLTQLRDPAAPGV